MTTSTKSGTHTQLTQHTDSTSKIVGNKKDTVDRKYVPNSYPQYYTLRADKLVYDSHPFEKVYECEHKNTKYTIKQIDIGLWKKKQSLKQSPQEITSYLQDIKQCIRLRKQILKQHQILIQNKDNRQKIKKFKMFLNTFINVYQCFHYQHCLYIVTQHQQSYEQGQMRNYHPVKAAIQIFTDFVNKFNNYNQIAYFKENKINLQIKFIQPLLAWNKSFIQGYETIKCGDWIEQLLNFLDDKNQPIIIEWNASKINQLGKIWTFLLHKKQYKYSNQNIGHKIQNIPQQLQNLQKLMTNNNNEHKSLSYEQLSYILGFQYKICEKNLQEAIKLQKIRNTIKQIKTKNLMYFYVKPTKTLSPTIPKDLVQRCHQIKKRQPGIIGETSHQWGYTFIINKYLIKQIPNIQQKNLNSELLDKINKMNQALNFLDKKNKKNCTYVGRANIEQKSYIVMDKLSTNLIDYVKRLNHNQLPIMAIKIITKIINAYKFYQHSHTTINLQLRNIYIEGNQIKLVCFDIPQQYKQKLRSSSQQFQHYYGFNQHVPAQNMYANQSNIVWVLGIIFHYIVSGGKYLFQFQVQKSIEEEIEQILSQQDQIPKQLKKLIKLMLKQNKQNKQKKQKKQNKKKEIKLDQLCEILKGNSKNWLQTILTCLCFCGDPEEDLVKNKQLKQIQKFISKLLKNNK